MKQCTGCQKTKPLTDFKLRSDTKKPMGRCRECDLIWHKEHYAQNRSRLREAAKVYNQRPEVKEHRKRYKASRKAQDKVWKKDWDLTRHYGITLEILEETVRAQNNHCPLCVRYFPTDSRQWHVDHCHNTGKVRGVLCGNCNIMVGQSKENPDTLRRAAEYLEKHK